MTKSLKILALATAALVAAPGAFALETTVLKVDVPFNFVVGNEEFPSGAYRIVTGANPNVVRIYSRTEDRMATAVCEPARVSVDKGWQLVFHKHDGQHFLKSIGTADGLGLALSTSDSERVAETAKSGATVAMR